MYVPLRVKQGVLTAVTLLTLGISAPAQAATWYASASNSSIAPSGTSCSVAIPCTLA